MTSWLLAFVLLFVGFMVADARGGSGIIDPEFVGLVIFLIVCAPIFLLGITAGIIAIAQGRSCGYASVLLNLIVMVALLFLRFGSSTPDTPASQAKRDKQMRDRERAAVESKRRRDNADISISENSLAYKSNSRYPRTGLVRADAIRAMDRVEECFRRDVSHRDAARRDGCTICAETELSWLIRAPETAKLRVRWATSLWLFIFDSVLLTSTLTERRYSGVIASLKAGKAWLIASALLRRNSTASLQPATISRVACRASRQRPGHAMYIFPFLRGFFRQNIGGTQTANIRGHE
jgi:hypothetical protein